MGPFAAPTGAVRPTRFRRSPHHNGAASNFVSAQPCARRARPRGISELDTDEPEVLRTRLRDGRKRLDAATPGSPEWAAASAATDALEQQLDALRPLPSVGGAHLVSRLGPMVLEDGCVVHGMVAATGPDGEALRLDISGIPDRVHSRREFVEVLEALAHQVEFILEITGDELELSFYAWDPESHQTGAPAAE